MGSLIKSRRILFDGGELSEPLMQRQLFLEWLTDFHHNEYVLGGSVLLKPAAPVDGIFGVFSPRKPTRSTPRRAPNTCVDGFCGSRAKTDRVLSQVLTQQFSKSDGFRRESPSGTELQISFSHQFRCGDKERVLWARRRPDTASWRDTNGTCPVDLEGVELLIQTIPSADGYRHLQAHPELLTPVLPIQGKVTA